MKCSRINTLILKMNTMDYTNLVKLEKQGKILIGVDRAMARKFYTDISMQKIREETGETPYLEKIIIWFAFLFGPISLLTSIVIGFLAFNWWGIISLLLCPIIYFAYSSSSVRGNSRMIGINILLLVSSGIHFLRVFDVPKITAFVIIFIFSLWLIRLLYCSSTFLLRNFVIRNKKAYQYLSQYLETKSIE